MNTDDRTLLELAARAAGLKTIAEPVWAGALTLENGQPWRPLIDDGDAHRLAVKLRIWLDYSGLDPENPSHIAAHYREKGLRHTLRWVHEHYVPEEMFTSRREEDRSHAAYQIEQGLTRGLEVATRRAITRAAAQIGTTKEASC